MIGSLGVISPDDSRWHDDEDKGFVWDASSLGSSDVVND